MPWILIFFQDCNIKLSQHFPFLIIVASALRRTAPSLLWGRQLIYVLWYHYYIFSSFYTIFLRVIPVKKFIGVVSYIFYSTVYTLAAWLNTEQNFVYWKIGLRHLNHEALGSRTFVDRFLVRRQFAYKRFQRQTFSRRTFRRHTFRIEKIVNTQFSDRSFTNIHKGKLNIIC